MTEQDRRSTKKNETPREDNNIVFIGTKPFINYVNGVAMQFITKNQPEVIVKARGKFINRAVDVAEVIKKRSYEGFTIEIKDIKTGSEDFENKEGKHISVSTIEITLTKK